VQLVFLYHLGQIAVDDVKSTADSSRLQWLAQGLVHWSLIDVALAGFGTGVFWGLASLCRRFDRAELWLVAALLPCWGAGTAAVLLGLGGDDYFAFDRAAVWALVVAILWGVRRARRSGSAGRDHEPEPPFDPRWIGALPASTLALLQSESAWVAVGALGWPVWPLVIAAMQLLVLGGLWVALAARAGTGVTSAPGQRDEAGSQPPAHRPTSTLATSPPRSQSGRVFISYRREETADITGRIYDRLVERFGKEQVFKDVDSMPLGVDFRRHLQQVVGTCDVVVAVIGGDWLTAVDADGSRRLDNVKDFIRIELDAALQRDIPVIPLLVRGAAVPVEHDLPGPLAPLAFRHAITVRPDPDFHRDMDRLIEGIDAHLKTGPLHVIRQPHGIR
jgi:hypothetical protein